MEFKTTARGSRTRNIAVRCAILIVSFPFTANTASIDELATVTAIARHPKLETSHEIFRQSRLSLE
ncbi:hypothetical protein [Roseibium sp. M-1]